MRIFSSCLSIDQWSAWIFVCECARNMIMFPSTATSILKIIIHSTYVCINIILRKKKRCFYPSFVIHIFLINNSIKRKPNIFIRTKNNMNFCYCCNIYDCAETRYITSLLNNHLFTSNTSFKFNFIHFLTES